MKKGCRFIGGGELSLIGRKMRLGFERFAIASLPTSIVTIGSCDFTGNNFANCVVCERPDVLVTVLGKLTYEQLQEHRRPAEGRAEPIVGDIRDQELLDRISQGLTVVT